MTDKDIKKLSRAELLQMLIEQVRENEALREELAELNGRLEEKSLTIDNAESLADASLKLSGVFEAADAAASQYIENIRDAEAKASEIIANARMQADEIVSSAQAESAEYWKNVSGQVEELYEEYIGLRELMSIAGNRTEQ